MMKDVRKAFGTFWSSQFLQGVIFEDFDEKHGFPGPLETIRGQFTAQQRKSKYERCGAKHSPLEKISKKMRRSKINQNLNFKRFHYEI